MQLLVLLSLEILNENLVNGKQLITDNINGHDYSDLTFNILCG